MITRTIEGPDGPFVIPGEPEVRTRCSEICCRHVFEGEYNYHRIDVEDVTSIVDVGCNVGSFAVWAVRSWWAGRIVRYDGYDPNPAAIELARENTKTFACHRALHNVGVTSQQSALFKEHDDWGGSRTCGETTGVPVTVLHPSDLPRADVLKVDAEGVEPEVFAHYRYLDTCKVVLFEYHDSRDRAPCELACLNAGLTQVRHHGSPPIQGIQCWVRL